MALPITQAPGHQHDTFPLCEKLQDAAVVGLLVAQIQDAGLGNTYTAVEFGHLVHDEGHKYLTQHTDNMNGDEWAQKAVENAITTWNAVSGQTKMLRDHHQLPRTIRQLLHMQQPTSDSKDHARFVTGCSVVGPAVGILGSHRQYNVNYWQTYDQKYPHLSHVGVTAGRLSTVILLSNHLDLIVPCLQPGCPIRIERKHLMKHNKTAHGNADIACPLQAQHPCKFTANRRFDAVRDHMWSTHDFYYLGDPMEYTDDENHLKRKSAPTLQGHLYFDLGLLRSLKFVLGNLDAQLVAVASVSPYQVTPRQDSLNHATGDPFNVGDELVKQLINVRVELGREWYVAIAAIVRELFVQDEYKIRFPAVVSQQTTHAVQGPQPVASQPAASQNSVSASLVVHSTTSQDMGAQQTVDGSMDTQALPAQDLAPQQDADEFMNDQDLPAQDMFSQQGADGFMGDQTMQPHYPSPQQATDRLMYDQDMSFQPRTYGFTGDRFTATQDPTLQQATDMSMYGQGVSVQHPTIQPRGYEFTVGHFAATQEMGHQNNGDASQPPQSVDPARFSPTFHPRLVDPAMYEAIQKSPKPADNEPNE